MKHKHNNKGIGSVARLRTLAAEALRKWREATMDYPKGIYYGEYIAYKAAAERKDWDLDWSE